LKAPFSWSTKRECSIARGPVRGGDGGDPITENTCPGESLGVWLK